MIPHDLEQAFNKLKDLSEYKDGITSMIIHDLKNPLNAILNTNENSTPEDQLKNTKRVGNQMLNLVMNLLDIQKYENAQMRLKLTDFYLFDIVEEAVKQVVYAANQKNVAIINRINRRDTVKVDFEIIVRVFVNLLSNAIKYSPNNREININAKENSNGFVEIEVTDQGPGIPEDKRKLVLSQIEDVEVVAEATDGREFLKKLPQINPDLVLMDIAMPGLNGIEASQQAIDEYPDLSIIALSMYGDEEYYHQMIRAGVKGFLLKNCGKSELETGIYEVLHGGNYFSQELLRKIIVNFSPSRKKSYHLDQAIKLTDREKEILLHICYGLSNNEIAQKLFISPKTVDNHRTNILAKTGAKNTANLVMFAIKNKLIEI